MTSLEGHSSWVNAVSFSLLDTMLASVECNYMVVKFWDARKLDGFFFFYISI